MREIKLILGNEEFTVRELSATRNREWRQRLEAPIKTIMDAMGVMGDPINTIADVPRAVMKTFDLFLPIADIVPDIVISYSSILEGKRAWLDENATETEYLNAFMTLARVAYPTDFFMQQAAAMKRLGSPKPPTLTS